MKTSTIVLVGALGVGGYFYVKGRAVQRAAGGSDPNDPSTRGNFSLGGIYDAIKAGVHAAASSGGPSSSESTASRVGRTVEAIFDSLFRGGAAPAPSVAAATDAHYESGVSDPLSHSSYRATELRTGTAYRTYTEDALINIA